MNTIWVIEKGSYSDYRVVGVYSTKEGAELVCARINGEGSYEPATVAEWPLDPGVEAINQGLAPFTVWMLRDGTTEKCVQYDDDFEYTFNDSLTIWRRSGAPAYRGQHVQDCLTGRVFAKDSIHAIKIVNERRVQMIANGEWK